MVHHARDSTRYTTRYHEIEARTVINRVRGMSFAWSVNPYRGCIHAWSWQMRFVRICLGRGWSPSIANGRFLWFCSVQNSPCGFTPVW